MTDKKVRPVIQILQEYHHNPTAVNSFAKFGVPRPVTGSQPFTAGNPLVLHPGLLPVVTSVSAAAPVAEYKNGLRNPSGALPAAIRRSFRSEITDAKIGLEQLVPATVPVSPPLTISTFSPCAEISGNARPVRVNLPEFVLPSVVRYAETADAWYDGCAKMFEKPPEEKVAAVSGAMPVVAPTEVMKGQPEGKVGTKVVQRADCEPETPPSPEAKRMEVPRAPSCMYALHSWLKQSH